MPTPQLQAAHRALSGSRCLVTGGAGFIGSHLVDALIEAGANVRVIDNLSTGSRANLDHRVADASLEMVIGDCADGGFVADQLAGIDFVFHQAAMASVPRSIREPGLCHAWCATSTVNLLSAAQQAGVKRVMLASTSAAYGNSPFVSKRESDPVDPLSPYAAAKLSAEQYCHAFTTGLGLETVVLRYFNVFGPRQDPESEYSAVIPRFVSMILSGQSPIIYGDGQQSRDFVYVKDVAAANLLAATTSDVAGTVFNVGRGSSTTLLELLDTLSDLLGRPITPEHQPPRIGDIRESLADITQARTRLGFDPQVSIEAGLRESIAYYERMVARSAG